MAALLREGVDTVLAYIGGAVIPLFDALGRARSRIRLIRPAHEQAGVHAADGWARVCGRPGVVLTTSGPGALNTLCGLGTAWADSVPLVLLTGQVGLDRLGTDAFQEADLVSMAAPVTKGAWQIRSLEELPLRVAQAFALARSGRPGPVLLDVPVSLQSCPWPHAALPTPSACLTVPPACDPGDAEEVARRLSRAERPLVLAGGGVVRSGAGEQLATFLEGWNLPCVTSLQGKGLPARIGPRHLGGVGMHGSMAGNRALHETDLLLVLGSRLNDRIMGNGRGVAEQGAVVQVDLDPVAIGRIRPVDQALQTSLSDFFEAMESLATTNPCSRTDWWTCLRSWRQEENGDEVQVEPSVFSPRVLVQALNDLKDPAAVVVTDVGQHQMWAHQYLGIQAPGTWVSSGGMGTMGFALPAALGAALARPQAQILALCGDGGFAMNVQEMETVRRLGLPVKVLLLDNGCLGMVRQWQDVLFERRRVETELPRGVDYRALARAYGWGFVSLQPQGDWRHVLGAFLQARQPGLCVAPVSGEACVWPMVPPGAAVHEGLNGVPLGHDKEEG